MEVLYYVREQEGIHVQDYLFTECFFIPEKNILFMQNQSIELYRIVNEQSLLEEAKARSIGKDVYENKRNPDVIGIPTFSDIKKVEREDSEIRMILENIEGIDSYRKKGGYGIEDLLKKISF